MAHDTSIPRACARIVFSLVAGLAAATPAAAQGPDGGGANWALWIAGGVAFWSVFLLLLSLRVDDGDEDGSRGREHG